MTEAGAALQFPYYFGENWDAFDECISDLSWLPSANTVVVLDSAHQLLTDPAADGRDHFRILLTTLNRAHEQSRDIPLRFGWVTGHTGPIR